MYNLKNKKIFNELVEEKSYEFQDLKEKIIPNSLIYKYKTEWRSPEDFSNYENLIDLFKNLRDGNVNPREELKNQINFKPDLAEIKNGNPKSKEKKLLIEKKILIFIEIILFTIWS